MPTTPTSPVATMDTSASGRLSSALVNNILELNGRISSSPDKRLNAPKLSPSSSSTIAGDETYSNYTHSRPTTPGSSITVQNNTNNTSGSSRSAIQISWNKTITSATSVNDITDLMYLYGNQFNAVNIATSLHRLASQFRFDVRRYSEAIRIVLDRARDTNFDGFSPRELANVVWAMAKTEMPCKEEIFNHVSRKAISSFSDSDYTPQAIANLLWGMAKAGYPNEALFEHLSGIAVRSGLRGFNAQNLSNSLWALSTAQLPNAQLFNMIGDFIVAEHNNLKGFSPQNMANAVWAMAKVNMPHVELFNLISDKATESRFAGFKPQEIANLVWAMSMCRLTKLELIVEVFNEITNLSEWKSQEISNLVWAVAIGKEIYSENREPNFVERRQDSFVEVVLNEIDKRGISSGWKPAELCNLVLGLHKLCSIVSVHGLVEAILAKVKREGGFVDWKLNELTNFVTVVVETNLIDPDVLVLIAQRACDLYGQEPEELVAGSTVSACCPSPSPLASPISIHVGAGSRRFSSFDDGEYKCPL